MSAPATTAPREEGDARYYRRFLNTSWVWNLQHGPRRRMYEMFVESMRPRETDRVLDFGISNLPEPMENIFEHHYPHPHRITAVGIEDCAFMEQRCPGLKFVRIKPQDPLPFPDHSFDIGYSGATLEHVGSHHDQATYVKELLRACNRVFITTPNRWYPIELHTRLPFLHWLPAPLFRFLLKKLGFDFYASEQNLNLLSASDLKKMVPAGPYKARIARNFFLGFPSNLILIIERLPAHG